MFTKFSLDASESGASISFNEDDFGIVPDESNIGRMLRLYPTTVRPLRISTSKRIEQFRWPTKPEEAYYIIEPKGNGCLFCMPWGLQVLSENYPIEPGDGLHFFRLSDHAVLRLPARFPREAACLRLIYGLGISVGMVSAINEMSVEEDWQVLRNHSRWARKVVDMTPLIELHDYESDFDRVRMLFLAAWAAHADWRDHFNHKLIESLAADLGSSSAWQWIEEEIGKMLGSYDVDIQFLRQRGAVKPTKKEYALGAQFDSAASEKLLRQVDQWRDAALREKTLIDYSTELVAFSGRQARRREATDFREMLYRRAKKESGQSKCQQLS